MEPMNQRPESSGLEARYRVLLILWLAMLSSAFTFFVLTMIIGMPEEIDANMMLVPFLMAVGIFSIILSFVLKRRFLSRAVERQSPELIQVGLVVALALCEVAALLGLVIFFVTGCHYYYLAFILSVMAMLLHMPRRDALRAATFQSGVQGFNAP